SGSTPTARPTLSAFDRTSRSCSAPSNGRCTGPATWCAPGRFNRRRAGSLSSCPCRSCTWQRPSICRRRRGADRPSARRSRGALVAVLMWGAASVMAKGADHVDGLTLAFHRLWVGALAMFVIFTLRGGRLRLSLLWAALPAGIAFAADIGLFFTAVKHTTVAN